MEVILTFMSGVFALAIFCVGVARVFERIYMKQYYASIIELGVWSLIWVGYVWITAKVVGMI
jgi:uncharacterized protein YqhQ